MIDKTTKAILAVIAFGLLANAVTPMLHPVTVAAQSAEANRTGRYQLLAAEHIIVPKDIASYTDKDLFRIDTVTGRTGKLISGATNSKGKREDFWAPIDVSEK